MRKYSACLKIWQLTDYLHTLYYNTEPMKFLENLGFGNVCLHYYRKYLENLVRNANREGL